jgi:DNA-binding GntR family transcriptional regulator
MQTLGAIHQSLDSMIYDRLKSMIIERKLMPGEKIYQDKLAHEFGVSRTPLVSALKKLEHEKLITAMPRKGFYVRLFSKQEMVHIFELREVLEGLAARKVAMRISDSQIHRLTRFFSGFEASDDDIDLKKYRQEDRRFHNFIIEVASGDILSSILETFNILTLGYQFIEQEGLVRPPNETIHEHKAIIEAIGKRDPIKAEELVRLHLRNSKEKLVRDALEEESTAFQ